MIIDVKGLRADTEQVTWLCDNSSGNCVQVAEAGGGVLVRDSSSPHGPVLTFTRAEWDAFAAGVRAGEFDF